MTPIEIWNMSLLKIGHSQGITALDEASREAWTGALVYDARLRYCLRLFPWAFATKYATLLLARGPVWDEDDAEMTDVDAWDATFTYVVGDVVRQASVNYYAIAGSLNQQPPNASFWAPVATATDAQTPDYANGDWDYAYRWPDDCLFVRRVVPPGGHGRVFHPDPIRFRTGRDVNGKLIFTHEPEAVIEYTMIDCDNLWTDELFLDLFTWDLAAIAAPSAAKNGLKQTDCLRLRELALQRAAGVDAREMEPDKDGDADWVANR